MHNGVWLGRGTDHPQDTPSGLTLFATGAIVCLPSYNIIGRIALHHSLDSVNN